MRCRAWTSRADAVVDVAGTPAAAPAHAPSAVFPQATGADELTASGIDGRGVGVAVVDTGITKLPDFAGRVIGGVDLSGEGNAYKDSYGHGTFVAGLVAGNGASSNGAYVGEAPNANLVAVKVAGKSGQTNASTVILGLQWILANQKAMGIKVANLSLGVKVTRSSRREPLDLAVERAWQQGLVIVTSAGNSGPSNGTVTVPGDDPLVITVGASDDQGTATTADDTMSTFSSAGPTSVDGWVKPDLVAPGRSVVSLRAPGSAIDTANPTARIGTANFVGSGTSFSAAITSGAVALVAQANPTATPDAIKGWLLGSAANGPVGNVFVDGHGQLDVATAAKGGPILRQTAPTGAIPTPGSTVSLAATWASSAWNGSAWNGSAWNGSAWNGSAWNGRAWNGSAWNGSAWNGSAWNGSAWNGSAWNGSAWNGSAWNGSAWN